MYSIIEVIYGVPMTEELEREIQLLCDRNDYDYLEEVGFEDLYSGCATFVTGYYGVCLDEFTVIQDPIYLSNLKLEPTEEQKQAAHEILEGLSPEIKELIEKHGSPCGVYFVPYTS